MTLTRVPPQRDGSSTASVSRVKLVDQRMADLIGRLRGPEFEDVHPARWRHTATGHHVETGYSYGGRTADHQFVISGREDDLTSFHELFPVSSA
jgi:hypothetical protein